MRFQQWVADLAATGHYVCPSSTAVPVDLTGVRPDGTGFRLRCRGTRVTLALYRPERLGWEVRVLDPDWDPEDVLSMWERRPFTAPTDPPAGARLVFADEHRPDHAVEYAERGWQTYEAGLLRVSAAAELLPRLLAEAAPR